MVGTSLRSFAHPTNYELERTGLSDSQSAHGSARRRYVTPFIASQSSGQLDSVETALAQAFEFSFTTMAAENVLARFSDIPVHIPAFMRQWSPS
jgi:hypothetical protein